jgi:hypothetical protein
MEFFFNGGSNVGTTDGNGFTRSLIRRAQIS